MGSLNIHLWTASQRRSMGSDHLDMGHGQVMVRPPQGPWMLSENCLVPSLPLHQSRPVLPFPGSQAWLSCRGRRDSLALSRPRLQEPAVTECECEKQNTSSISTRHRDGISDGSPPPNAEQEKR